MGHRGMAPTVQLNATGALRQAGGNLASEAQALLGA
jgi:hypothetical protein